MSFRYILRYYIDPGFHVEDRIAELVDFCRAGNVEEVMLFFNAEELNTGHYTSAELAPWLATAKEIKAALDKNNVALSINPWTTTVHSPRGRRLKPGQNYTLMTGDTGNDNGVTACPLDPALGKDLASLWAEVARELKPTAIWLEDDLRLHNHGAALGEGGCFCPLHLALMSELVGRPVTRQEVIDAVFGPGKVHPWRKIWFELNHQAIMMLVGKIRRAVEAVSPDTKLALMCGYLDTAGAEGRFYPELQDAVGMRDGFMVRPTMSPYTEVWTMRKYPVQARLDVAAMKRPLRLYPELESGPRHGSYSKGCGYAGREILEAACIGSHGITMNIYDMLGCGIAIDRRFGPMLHRIKPVADALAELKLDDDRAEGANILYSDRAPLHMHAVKGHGATYSKLNNRSGEWGNVASILGFSYRFTDKIEHSAQPYLVNGQTLSAFGDDAVKTLLGNTVVLDAPAASSLIDLGFGHLIGLTSCTTHHTNDLDFSYEEILEADPSVYSLAYPRMTAQRAARELYAFTPREACETASVICDPTHRKLFPGTMVFRNELGGTIITLAYSLGDAFGDEWFYMGFFNEFRRIFLQKLLRDHAPAMRGAFAEEQPFQVFRVGLDNGEIFFAAFNSTTDEADSLKLRLTGTSARSFAMLSPAGAWEPARCEAEVAADGSLLLTFPGPIPVHGGVFIKSI